MKRQPFKKGDKLVCMADSGYPSLTIGKVYTVVKDEEPGILDTPYVTTTSDDPQKPITAHVFRFALHDGEEVTPEKLERIREERRKQTSRGI